MTIREANRLLNGFEEKKIHSVDMNKVLFKVLEKRYQRIAALSYHSQERFQVSKRRLKYIELNQ